MLGAATGASWALGPLSHGKLSTATRLRRRASYGLDVSNRSVIG